ncbi:MAG: hypothetical protein ACP5GH_07305 [Nitrososphaeria archaeon]
MPNLVFLMSLKSHAMSEYALSSSPAILTVFVNMLIWHAVEADSYLMKYSPYLSYIGHSEGGNGIYIYDYKMDRICEVSCRNGELCCDVDDSTRCIHVGFAYALPEMYSVLKKLGYKSPRSTR